MLHRKRSHDENKVEKVFQEHNLIMRKMARDILLDHHLAEDAVQEAFLKVLHKNRDGFFALSDHDLISYLIITVKHTAIDIYRKRRDIAIDPMDSVYDSMDRFGDFTIGEGEFEVVWEILEGLPYDHKYPLLLKYVFGYSEKEIAVFFSLSYAAMRKRIQRVKHTIRERVKQGNGDNDQVG